MKVTTVATSIRYSRQLDDGSWKGIELSAEGSLEGQDTWTKAQASLYQQLGHQLKTLRGNGTQQAPESPEKAANGTEVTSIGV